MKTTKGAESIIIFKENSVLKKRIPKPYRIKEFDEYIRKKRNKREVKILKKLEKHIKVPKIVNIKDFEIEMELIKGETLKDVLEKKGLDKKIIEQMAEIVSKIHELGIIHGDLTLKNFILKDNDLYLIDFGLSFFSHSIEDKATDLVVLKDIFSLEGKEELFDYFLEHYKQKDKEKILKKIEEIEERGRYKKKQKL